MVRGVSFALMTTAALAACGDGDPPRITAVFDVPGTTPTTATSAEFYNTPFPSNLRLTADHHLDLTGWPARTPIVQTYVAAAEAQLDGFGPNSTIFTRVNGAVDVASLPDPATSQTSAASVYLVNVDATSTDFGKRTPVRVHFTAGAYGTIGTNSLAAEPYPGFPLREGTTYALVITDRVHDENGRSIAGVGECEIEIADLAFRGDVEKVLEQMAFAATRAASGKSCRIGGLRRVVIIRRHRDLRGQSVNFHHTNKAAKAGTRKMARKLRRS